MWGERVNELQLQTGPYRTTFIGTEIVRESTKDEWQVYGEILRRVDEAKQWAIGDWLVDGKRHYGDGLYQKAAGILGQDYNVMARYARLSAQFEFSLRKLNLSWAHHNEVISLKPIKENDKGKLQLSEETDYEKIQEFLQKAEAEKLSVRDLREVVGRYKNQQTEKIRFANEPEKYSIIYADPPWEYEYVEIQVIAIENHYPTMSEQELIEYPVKNKRAKNCVIYMWTTAPKLDVAMRVLKAWGFDYKTCLVWDKVKHNMGFYNSVRHELLLIGGYGQAAPDDKGFANSTDSVYVEERTEHSVKPEYYYSMIEHLHSGKTKRLELFKRGKHRNGWDVQGDEA